MIKWIMACISSTSYSINVNGERHGYFKGKRGLRQGDPMSPYLFILVMEILTLMLKRRVRESGDFGYHNRCSKQKIIDICFADDLIMFSRGDIQSAKILIEALEEFKCASGLVPSIPKSTVFFCNVVAHVKTAILQLMPFEEDSLPIKYLGVPLISSRLVHRDCKILVERVKKRIGDWKNKRLSFAGRLQLCLSVVSSMHVYWASVFILPIGILNEIEQLMGGFLWCQGDYHRGKAKVAWNDVCLPKNTRSRHVIHVMLTATHVLVMKRRLKTQDRLRPWDVGEDVDLPSLRCPLCKVEQDSHDHLFFACNFSSQVWNVVVNKADLPIGSHIWSDIWGWILSIARKNNAICIVGRLILAASSYYIWQERNNRIHVNGASSARSVEQVASVILDIVRLKLETIKFKRNARVAKLKTTWNLPAD
ncbi:putative reverse transcriptase domain, reverse transcriptase zinc-binding domain protein [Tanacetum coccineum]